MDLSRTAGQNLSGWLKTTNNVRIKTYRHDDGIIGEWVSETDLADIAGVKIGSEIGPEISPAVYTLINYFYTENENHEMKRLYQITWPKDGANKNGEIQVVDGIRIKHDTYTTLYNAEDLKKLKIIEPKIKPIPYFSIEDLQKAGIIQ